MRYTTIIDITEQPEIYRNQKIRLLYLHLVLKSGFHDDDRDVCRKSIRSLALETGLTVSSVRQQRQLEQQYARMDQDTHDREFIEAYEKYLKALQDGSIGMAGQMFLQRNKSRYESLKSKS